MASFENARRAHGEAAEIARSDARAHEGESLAWVGIIDVRTREGLPSEDAFEAALAACDKALQADPESVVGHTLKSNVLWRRAERAWMVGGDPRSLLERSIESAREAVRWGPERSGGYLSLGTAAAILAHAASDYGDDPSASLAQAIASLGKALQIDPALDEAYSKLGNAYDIQARHERKRGRDPSDALTQAVLMHKKATEKAPGFAGSWNNLGAAYRSQAEYERDRGADPRLALDRAVESLGRATSANPKHASAFANLGVIHTMRADHELNQGLDPSGALAEARKALQTASRLNPLLAIWVSLFQSQADVLAARWALRQGHSPERHFAEARSHLEPFVKVRDAESRMTLADLYRWQAEWQQKERRPAHDAIRRGLAAAAEAIAIHPGSAKAHALRGALQLLEARGVAGADRRKSAQAALQSLEQAFKMDGLLRREFGSILAEAQGLVSAR